MDSFHGSRPSSKGGCHFSVNRNKRDASTCITKSNFINRNKRGVQLLQQIKSNRLQWVREKRDEIKSKHWLYAYASDASTRSGLHDLTAVAPHEEHPATRGYTPAFSDARAHPPPPPLRLHSPLREGSPANIKLYNSSISTTFILTISSSDKVLVNIVHKLTYLSYSLINYVRDLRICEQCLIPLHRIKK